MFGLDHPQTQSRAAALLRSVANDLKRDDAAAEADLGLPEGSFGQYVSGRRPVTWDLIERVVRVWPVNERDLLPVHDDCPDGVSIFRVADSVKSSRVIERGGRPYYEYRDTAMSRVASFRPEWIRMLVTADGGADDPQVRWNRGHLLYQFTYFVGPVNYYYEWEGTRHCARMSTGDSVWGLPFAPHSFTARDGSEPAYILALTYGGGLVGDAQRELAVLGEAAARALAIDPDPARAQGELLRAYLRARVMTRAELAAGSGIATHRLDELLTGTRTATAAELTALAGALAVSERDLLPPRTGVSDGVVIQRASSATRWRYPDREAPAYLVTRLAADPAHPHTTGLELSVLRSEVDADSFLVTHQHQYLYVLGDAPVLLIRADGDGVPELLEPGDSGYVKPGVRLAFAAAGPQGSRILLLRIEGAVTTDIRFALGSMAEAGIRRYVAESEVWY
jgi:transcriptional regulator with XRE-family HTH domain